MASLMGPRDVKGSICAFPNFCVTSEFSSKSGEKESKRKGTVLQNMQNYCIDGRTGKPAGNVINNKKKRKGNRINKVTKEYRITDANQHRGERR